MQRTREGKLRLGVFFNHTGHHVASWMHPGAQIDAGVNFQHYKEITLAAERAKFDLIFFADSAATREADPNALKRAAQYTAYFEPITLLSALSSVTERIGLVATATTSYNEPYHIARKYASLDHLSGGRAGWNVVTSGNKTEAFNFGRDEHYTHAQRYDRAREFVEVVKGLWDSWDDDAFIRDRASGVYFDPDKLHYLRHEGPWFKVRGPLNVPRPPQGYPVLFQAGTSPEGRAFAARTAEALFTVEHRLDDARGYYAEIKSRAREAGRNPDHLKVMPGINPIVGRTEAEAREKHGYLQSLIHPDVGREFLSMLLGAADLSKYPLDGPLPELPPNDASGGGTYRNAVELARRENLTIRQLYMRLAGARGKLTLVGTPTSIVDTMEQWWEAHGCDGFIIQPSYLPGALNDFIELVIPELRNRGLFREDYEGRTLRENLGLPRPASRYAD